MFLRRFGTRSRAPARASLLRSGEHVTNEAGLTRSGGGGSPALQRPKGVKGGDTPAMGCAHKSASRIKPERRQPDLPGLALYISPAAPRPPAHIKGRLKGRCPFRPQDIFPTMMDGRLGTDWFCVRDRYPCGRAPLRREKRRSVLTNEAYWHSFCPTDLPVPTMSWLKSRKGNGTIACR